MQIEKLIVSLKKELPQQPEAEPVCDLLLQIRCRPEHIGTVGVTLILDIPAARMRSELEYSLHGVVGPRIAFTGGAKDWDIPELGKLTRGLAVERAGQQRQSDDVRVAGGRLDAQENTAACAGDPDDLGIHTRLIGKEIHTRVDIVHAGRAPKRYEISHGREWRFIARAFPVAAQVDSECMDAGFRKPPRYSGPGGSIRICPAHMDEQDAGARFFGGVESTANCDIIHSRYRDVLFQGRCLRTMYEECTGERKRTQTSSKFPKHVLHQTGY